MTPAYLIVQFLVAVVIVSFVLLVLFAILNWIESERRCSK